MPSTASRIFAKLNTEPRKICELNSTFNHLAVRNNELCQSCCAHIALSPLLFHPHPHPHPHPRQPSHRHSHPHPRQPSHRHSRLTFVWCVRSITYTHTHTHTHVRLLTSPCLFLVTCPTLTHLAPYRFLVTGSQPGTAVIHSDILFDKFEITKSELEADVAEAAQP
jgi:hypothetical protein